MLSKGKNEQVCRTYSRTWHANLSKNGHQKLQKEQIKNENPKMKKTSRNIVTLHT